MLRRSERAVNENRTEADTSSEIGRKRSSAQRCGIRTPPLPTRTGFFIPPRTRRLRGAVCGAPYAAGGTDSLCVSVRLASRRGARFALAAGRPCGGSHSAGSSAEQEWHGTPTSIRIRLAACPTPRTASPAPPARLSVRIPSRRTRVAILLHSMAYRVRSDRPTRPALPRSPTLRRPQHGPCGRPRTGVHDAHRSQDPERV